MSRPLQTNPKMSIYVVTNLPHPEEGRHPFQSLGVGRVVRCGEGSEEFPGLNVYWVEIKPTTEQVDPGQVLAKLTSKLPEVRVFGCRWTYSGMGAVQAKQRRLL